MDAGELGQVLRARRKSAGRTIASVAMDAGLSVPYIANLENGRGNPTLSALQRLATALGTRLDVSLGDVSLDNEATAAEPPPDAALDVLMDAPRVRSIAADMAKAASRDAGVVRRDIRAALLALQAVKGAPATDRDLDRLLDVILLSRSRP